MDIKKEKWDILLELNRIENSLFLIKNILTYNTSVARMESGGEQK